MAGIILLLGLCAVMAIASFFAGAVPLSMSLSQSQLRLVSSIGVGILVGTSLIVIIPEGIEAAASSPIGLHAHKVRTLARPSPWTLGRLHERDMGEHTAATPRTTPADAAHVVVARSGRRTPAEMGRADDLAKAGAVPAEGLEDEPSNADERHRDGVHRHAEMPALEVGLSMVLGFILMFLIDRLPEHASRGLQSGHETQHFSLDNLGGAPAERPAGDGEEEGFPGSLAPGPRHSRSLASTVGLVIHAAADGIALGASSATSGIKVGFVIFVAIMIHKAPAAFGLTSLLLRQGLSKRAARGHLVVFSLAAPAGAVAAWLLIKVLGGGDLDGESGTWWTGMLLLFSGGTFLYVAMHAMQEDGLSHGHDGAPGANGYADATAMGQRKAKGPEIRDTLATVMGMLLPLVTQIGHHH